jgi:hypothetical protein
MTNTHYIGSEKQQVETDKLSAYHGYKVVALGSLGEGKADIVSPHFSQRKHAFADSSTCEAGPSLKKVHDFANCQCGFYSYSVPSEVINHWKDACGGYSNHALVEIAASGKVAVCENGFRSSHQRITKILFHNCWNCGKKGEQIIQHSTGYYVAGCVDCLTKLDVLDASLSFDEFAKINSVEGYAPLVVGSMPYTADGVTEFFTGVNVRVAKINALLEELSSEGDLISIDKVLEKSRSLLTTGLNFS